MNLTYEVDGTKYTIFNNGKPWIVQDGYFPYQGQTVEESAQNHIDAILTEMNAPPVAPIEEELAQSKQAIETLTENLIDFKIAYMSVPCQSHQDYPVLIEGLLEGAGTDGE